MRWQIVSSAQGRGASCYHRTAFRVRSGTRRIAFPVQTERPQTEGALRNARLVLLVSTPTRAPIPVRGVPGGSFSSSPTGSCDPCAAGKYQDQTGQTSCKNCTAGYFSAVEGRHKCDRCELGFHSESGQSECTRCTTGFPCPEDRPRYLELLVVNDKRRCDEYGSSRDEMHAHTAAVVDSAAARFSGAFSQGR